MSMEYVLEGEKNQSKKVLMWGIKKKRKPKGDKTVRGGTEIKKRRLSGENVNIGEKCSQQGDFELMRKDSVKGRGILFIVWATNELISGWEKKRKSDQKILIKPHTKGT